MIVDICTPHQGCRYPQSLPPPGGSHQQSQQPQCPPRIRGGLLGRLAGPYFYPGVERQGADVDRYPGAAPGDEDRGHRYAVLFVRSLSSLLADRLARVTKVEAKPITSTASASQGA
jgi:hypothetical protein